MQITPSTQPLSHRETHFLDRMAATVLTDQTPVLWTLETRTLAPSRVTRWRTCLDEDERDSMDRLLQEDDRRDTLAAHTLRRALLSAILHQPPGSWRFTRRSPHGKPTVHSACLHGISQTVDVSLTHTRGLVAAMVGCDCRVGVDAESLARPGSIDEVIPMVLSLAEARWVQAQTSEEARTRAFLDRWVIKEAVAKLLGLGLAHPLTRLETRESPLEVQLHTPWPSLHPAPIVRRLRPTPSHVLAVAATDSRPGLPDLIWRHLDAAAVDRALTQPYASSHNPGLR